MKRCPKCNRTYPTDTQRFCTADGGMLMTVEVSPAKTVLEPSPAKTVLDATPAATVLFDSDDDAPTKAISRELVPEDARKFDPFKTTVDNAPQGKKTPARCAGGPRGICRNNPHHRRSSLRRHHKHQRLCRRRFQDRSHSH